METQAVAAAILLIAAGAIVGSQTFLTDGQQPDQNISLEDEPDSPQTTGNESSIRTEREIKGRDTNNTAENDTGDQKRGLVLLNSPVNGEWVTLTLYQEGEPVEDEEIFLNENSIGETDQFGEIRFQVPNKDEISITTENELDQLRRRVQDYRESEEVSFNMIAPGENSTVEAYTSELKAGIDTQKSISYSLFVDGDKVTESSSDQGTISINRTVFLEKGTHRWRIAAETEQNTYESGTKYFKTTKQIPEPQITINNPSSEVNNHTVNLNYDVEADYNYDISTKIDGKTVRGDRNNNPEFTSEFSNQFSLQQGQHNIEITVNPHGSDRAFTETKNFSTTVEQPATEIKLKSPKDQSETSPPVELAFGIEAYQDLNYTTYLDRGEGFERIESGSGILTEGEELIPFSNGTTGELDLEYGSHQWYLEVNPENSEKIKSETREFEVVEFQGR